MKSIKLILAVLLALVSVLPVFAEGKLIYEDGVYGQDFYIYEYTDGDLVSFSIFMTDNKSNRITTFDKNKNYETIIRIASPQFKSAVKYAEALQAAKDFLRYTTNYISMVDVKDICDNEKSSCKLHSFDMKENENKEQYIYIVYICNDIIAFCELASTWYR